MEEGETILQSSPTSSSNLKNNNLSDFFRDSILMRQPFFKAVLKGIFY